MLIDLKRVIAYICPYCSNVSVKQTDIFKLSSNAHTELVCDDADCGEDCVYIHEHNGKYKIEIECPVCGDMHTFFASTSAFWHKPLLSFQCPVGSMDIFFAGTAETIHQALEDNTMFLSDMAESFDSVTEEINLLYKIIDCIHDLLTRHKISCRCGCTEVTPDISNGQIVLRCPQCRSRMVIDPTPANLEQISHSGSIIIGNKKK